MKKLWLWLALVCCVCSDSYSNWRMRHRPYDKSALAFHVDTRTNDIVVNQKNVTPPAALSEDELSGVEDLVAEPEVEDEQTRAYVQAQEGQEVELIPADVIKSDKIFETKARTGVFPEHDFDPEAKRKDVITLLDNALEYLKTHTLDQSFYAFNNNPQFIKGDLYIFAYNSKGTCLANGYREDLIWKDMYNLKDGYGVPIVQAILEKGRQGGGWITYQWLNATKVSYVKEVIKDGSTYTFGVGYYPHSKVDAVVNLVKGAVALFNDVMKQGRSKEEALATFSYPLGRFVQGDLYLYAVDFNGLQLAHGENPELIGSNAWSYHDSAGKLVNQEIISKLKLVDFGTGVWVDYVSRNAPKRAYAEKVKDAQGKLYFIACGYYPDADRKQVENLVSRGYKYMKSNGKTMAVKEFTDKANNNFRYGDLYLFIYDLKGICVAHGGNPTEVGMNMLDARDENGVLYIREFIKQGEKGGGWVDFKEKGAFTSVYVEEVDLGTGRYIIGCQIFPISKRDTMILLVKGAADYLRHHENDETFREFVDQNGKFIRGDLEVFACDTQGICFAAGDEYNLIWNNLMNAKDDDGKYYIKMMINVVKHNRGPSTISYRLHGAQRVAYIEPVEKAGKMYLVSSGFYY